MTPARVEQPLDHGAAPDHRSLLEQPEAVAEGLAGVARGGALNLTGAAYSALAGFAATALVTRGLGSGEAGMFFTATTVFMLSVTITKLGAPTGLVYWLARLRALGQRQLSGRCLRVALTPVLAAATGLGAVLYLAAPHLARLADHTMPSGGSFSGGDADLFANQLRILAVALPLAAVAETLLAATRGCRVMRATVMADKLGRPTLQLAGLAAAAAAAAASNWFTLAWGAPWALVALAGWLWLRRVLPRGPAPHATDRRARPQPWRRAKGGPELPRLSRQFWRFTWPRGAANVLQLMLQRLDILLIAGLLGFAAAAVYAAATRFVVVGQLGAAAISSAVEPRFAESLARDDHVAARGLYQGATGWLVLIAWPIYLLTATFAPFYLGLFGPAYATGDAVAVVLLLCAAMLLASSCGMVDMVLAMTGSTIWNLANVSVALAVNVGLNLLLIGHLGIVGAAISWAGATVVKNLLPLAQLARRQGLHPYGSGTLVAAGLAVTCFGVLPLAARAGFGAQLPALLAATAVGAACYLAGLWRWRNLLQLPALSTLKPFNRPIMMETS